MSGRRGKMEKSYWSLVLKERIGRRRAIAGIGGSAAGAALLIACGGGSSKPKQENVSSLVAVPADTTKSAVRGGALSLRRSADVTHFDPFVPLGNAGLPTTSIFSRLIRLKPGLRQPAGTETIGDIMESWEFSPDKTQVTFKVRSNAHWHNVPPVNGRAVDADDIAASWKRFESTAVNAANYSAAKNPNAPIASMTSVDSRTVAIK